MVNLTHALVSLLWLRFCLLLITTGGHRTGLIGLKVARTFSLSSVVSVTPSNKRKSTAQLRYAIYVDQWINIVSREYYCMVDSTVNCASNTRNFVLIIPKEGFNIDSH